MSTGLIILLVVIAVLAFAAVTLTPRAREASRRRTYERALENRRMEVAGAHRTAADVHRDEADAAEREARGRREEAATADRRAATERAEAAEHAARAHLHERGLADDELLDAGGDLRVDSETERVSH
jgi:type II secretory pathway pseudopilin PulG